jgi:hypothetical protein
LVINDNNSTRQGFAEVLFFKTNALLKRNLFYYNDLK